MKIGIRNLSLPLIIFCLISQGCAAPIGIVALSAVSFGATGYFVYKRVQLSTGGSVEVNIKDVKLSEDDQKALSSLKTLAVYPGDLRNVKVAEALSGKHNLNIVTPLLVQQTFAKKGMGRMDFFQMTEEEKMKHAKDVCQILNTDGLLFISESSMSSDHNLWSLERAEMTTKINASVFHLKSRRMIWSLEGEIVWKIGSHTPSKEEKEQIVVSSVTEKFLSDAGKRTETLKSSTGQAIEDEVTSPVFDNVMEGQVIPTSPSKEAVTPEKSLKSISPTQEKTESPPPPPSMTTAQIQQRLSELGYQPGPTDGKIGKRTINALKNFQQNNNLPITGKADNETVNKLLRKTAKDNKEQSVSPSAPKAEAPRKSQPVKARSPFDL